MVVCRALCEMRRMRWIDVGAEVGGVLCKQPCVRGGNRGLERGVEVMWCWRRLSYLLGDTYTKIGTIQRRLAWPLRKDDTQNREAFHIFREHLLQLASSSPMSLRSSCGLPWRWSRTCLRASKGTRHDDRLVASAWLHQSVSGNTQAQTWPALLPHCRLGCRC